MQRHGRPSATTTSAIPNHAERKGIPTKILALLLATFLAASGALLFEICLKERHDFSFKPGHSAAQLFQELHNSVNESRYLPVQSLAISLRQNTSNINASAELPFRDIVIIVPSHWSEVGRRCSIRDSWKRSFSAASPCKECRQYQVELLFLVGNAILTNSSLGREREAFQAEAEQFGDTHVLPDFAEHEQYKERSTKSLKSMKYAIKNFRFFLLLKADTDSYVFADRLIKVLKSHGAFDRSKRIYMGNFEQGTRSKVITSERVQAGKIGTQKVDPQKAKWLDDTFHQLTGLDTYPSHAKGPGYVLSYALVRYLTEPPVPFKPFTCEDTAIGAYLMATDHKKIPLPVALSDGGCAKKSIVIDHYVKPDTMRRRWRRFEVLGDACMVPPLGNKDPAHKACVAMEKKTMIWRVVRGHTGPEVDGFEMDLRRGHDHLDSRCGVCGIRFEWKTYRWGQCKAMCGGGEQWRCLQCVGSDGQLYDEWECPFGEMPHRSLSCVPKDPVTCGPLYHTQVRECSGELFALDSKVWPRLGVPKALWLVKQILDLLRIPFVLDPFLVANWEKTCLLPLSPELTVFVMYRYVTSSSLAYFDYWAQTLGMQKLVAAQKNDLGIGYMCALSCPASLCGSEIFIQVKVAGEEEGHIWWPRWEWMDNTSKDGSKGKDGSLQMQVCRSGKPSYFEVISVEKERYLAGSWPAGTELVCEASPADQMISGVAWQNEDNIVDVFVQTSSVAALSSLGLASLNSASSAAQLLASIDPSLGINRNDLPL